MMASRETGWGEIVERAEAMEGLLAEEYELGEGMGRDALSLLMNTDRERAEVVKVLEAMEQLVMEEDYENVVGMERDPLSLVNMIVKELLPMDEESVMLLDWIDEGVYDSVNGNYMKTLLFTSGPKEGQEIEEYTFSFSCSRKKRTRELVVKLSWIGSKTEKLTLKLDEGELAPQRMRSSACKLIRMCALCTGMLEEMQEGCRTIMEMISADDIKVKATEYGYNFENVNWSFQNLWDDADESYDSKESKSSNGFLFCAALRRYQLHLDSGSSYHVCGNRDCFHNFKKLKDPVALNSVEETEMIARHKGDIVYQEVKLKGVLFVPQIKFSVVSIGLLAKQGLMTCIGEGRFTIYNVDEPAIVGYGVLNKVDKDYCFCSMDWLKTGNTEAIDAEQNESEEDEDEDEGWIVDSLCANHMVGDKKLLTDCVPVRREFQTASGVIVCTLQGSVKTATMVLNDVLYCKDIGRKLISVSQLDEKGFMFTFYKRRCEIQLRDPIHSSGHALMNARTNHYIISEFSDEKPLPDPQFSASPKKRRRGGSKKKEQ